ncbi:hypothetical protein BD410DRAFT_825707 [Rickenella mellea]|uniref:Mid2 domain-containing protein n=1 Tax=Rickenella mellea TaxID=50990 RepID=A0A4Y7QG00_9AGAM|nr:hypothetical protein BD410DRAFT_825707 [Rickenella mellea]
MMLAAVAFVLAGAIHVSAQTIPPFPFIFGFGTISGTTFPQCATLPMFVQASNGGDPTSVSKPPYTLTSYAPNNIGVQFPVGSDPNALSWQVKHPVGSQLFLSMVDSAGNQGGVPLVYTVVAGATGCLPQTSTSSFVINTNSSVLNTCDPLGITISGGKQPYELTFAMAGLTMSTASLGPSDNMYTFINRVPPNTQFIVSATDATGQLSVSSGIISTRGSTDATCPGLLSSSGVSTGGTTSGAGTPTAAPSTAKGGHHTSATSQSSSPTASAAKAASHHTTAIAGGLAAGVIVILLIVGAVFYFIRSRGRGSRGGQIDLDAPLHRVPSSHNATPWTYNSPTPYADQSQSSQYQYPLTEGYQHSQQQSFRPQSTIDNKSVYSSVGNIMSPSTAENPFDSQINLGQYPRHTPTPSVNGLSVNGQDDPLRYRDSYRSSDLPYARPPTQLALANPDRGAPITEKQLRMRQMQQEDEMEQEVIVRHRDAGAIVDLPPAYGEQEPTIAHPPPPNPAYGS